MQIIDTHAHIYHPNFDNDIDEVINRAKQLGVECILLPNVDIDSIAGLHRLTDNYPNYCIPMMGLHPTSVDENYPAVLAQMKSYFDTRTYIAVGEIGIDLYWDKTMLKEQKLAFEEQLRWSMEYDLPVVIHSREAIAETIDSIRKIGASKLRGVIHSFTGTADELQEVLALDNFYIGINGVITYKKSDLAVILKATDLSRIIIETDAPYLPPVPYRGKRNESSYTIEVVKKLSDVYEISPEEVGRITTANAKKLFRLK